ncbi:MAG: hypothetical protein GXC73_14270 [Chitinophagaceae bacterium]|nr:hypothetical protein [Chitinophagaceae bacterium]
MQIRHKELVINTQNPFATCKLNRKKYADVLTSIVGSYADGFVLAINNEWGTGKSTFVKMWDQQLKNEGFRTLFFNAWENDFETNPLAAILGELKKLFPKGENKKFKKLVKTGASIAKNAVPALVKGLSAPYIKIDELGKVVEGASKGVLDVLEKDVEEYAKKQKGIIDFRRELEEYVSQGESDKPLVFIIDELDRCRPNFAVEVLEQMKHFFSVPGIIFVLSIDKEQLGNAVKGVYGSEHINAAEYLRRFIDIEYSIPSPSVSDFCKYLYDYYDFSFFFHNQMRVNIPEFRGEEEFFKLYSELLFSEKKLTLRQIEKIYSHARIGLTFFKSNYYLFPTVYVYLIFLFHYKPTLFDQIKERKIPVENFLIDVCSGMPNPFKKEHYNLLNNTKGILWFSYYNYYRAEYPEFILYDEDNEGIKVNFKNYVQLPQGEDRVFFERRFNRYIMSEYYSFSIDFLLDRVALLKSVDIA